MPSEFAFESKLIYQVLRQEGAVEKAPCIALQLEMSAGPRLYAAGATLLNKAVWEMKIHKIGDDTDGVAQPWGTVRYATVDSRPHCTIDLYQSPARYRALLDMFKDGYVSEITLVVDGLYDQPDFSKRWETASVERLALASICFEFPLPQQDA